MKKLMYLLIFCSCMILFVGCGSPTKNETQIQSDLDSYFQSEYENSEKVIECKIDKRQTEKEKELDVVWCTIKTEDEQCVYEKSAILTYVLYDCCSAN